MTAFAFGVIGAIWFAAKGRENTNIRLPDAGVRLTVAAQ